MRRSKKKTLINQIGTKKKKKEKKTKNFYPNRTHILTHVQYIHNDWVQR